MLKSFLWHLIIESKDSNFFHYHFWCTMYQTSFKCSISERLDESSHTRSRNVKRQLVPHASLVAVWIKPAGTAGTVQALNLHLMLCSPWTVPALCSNDQPENYWLDESRLVRPPLKHGNITSQWGVCQSLAIDWYCNLNQYRCKARFQKR